MSAKYGGKGIELGLTAGSHDGEALVNSSFVSEDIELEGTDLLYFLTSTFSRFKGDITL